MTSFGSHRMVEFRFLLVQRCFLDRYVMKFYIPCGVLLLILCGCGTANTSSNEMNQRLDHIREMEASDSEAAENRKNRSIAILEREKVPFIEHLPVIETASETERRSKEEVARRAMALCIVAAKGEGLEHDMVLELVERYKIKDVLTPNERAFIANRNPSQQDRVQFTWRYESYWVLLWALGYIDDLKRPDSICDVLTAVTLLRDVTPEEFIAKAELRSQKEILDQADLAYRYHWATTDARVNNQDAPAGLDPSVVYERHYALNWLIGYLDQAWDDISTDT